MYRKFILIIMIGTFKAMKLKTIDHERYKTPLIALRNSAQSRLQKGHLIGC